jgi:hypothetical protein
VGHSGPPDHLSNSSAFIGGPKIDGKFKMSAKHGSFTPERRSKVDKVETPKHGGARPGAGRPRGSKSWRTLAVERAVREMDAAVKAAGRELSPLDLRVAVANARGAPPSLRRKAQRWVAPYLAAQAVLRRGR